MSEQTPDEIEGIVYVGEDGEVEGDPVVGTDYDGQQPEEVTPESLDAHLEEKVVELDPDTPGLVTAADLLDERDPLSSLPVEPPDEETPPDSAAPAFIVTRNAYGPGAHSFKRVDGTPIGRWLDTEHPELDGGQVAEMLILMGLDGEAAAWFGLQRDRRMEADATLGESPIVRQALAQEAVRLAQKEKVQEALLKAQKAKK